jgi:hypothetical protein
MTPGTRGGKSDRKLHRMAVSRICQVETDNISWFPKPQVAGPIPAEGAR